MTVHRDLRHLLDPERLYAWADLDGNDQLPPRRSGTYAWYFRRPIGAEEVGGVAVDLDVGQRRQVAEGEELERMGADAGQEERHELAVKLPQTVSSISVTSSSAESTATSIHSGTVPLRHSRSTARS